MTITTRYASAPWGDERGGLLDELLDRPEWQRRAACRGVPLATFFPEAGGDLEPARLVCAACPVRQECRSYALEAREPILHGVWAGLSMVDRKRLRRASA